MCFIWFSTLPKSDFKEAKAHLKYGTKNVLTKEKSAYSDEAKRGAGEGETCINWRCPSSET